jgi:signal transduction histidine kinase/CheY-like chemotaxis protein
LIKAQSHKDEFIAVVSHELRTPLNAILGFSGLLETHLRQSSQKINQHVQNSAKHLLQIISDILDFSQLQANKLSLVQAEVNPLHLLESAKKRANIIAKEKKLELIISQTGALPDTVWIDEFRVGQALDHLIRNAIKFTQHGYIHLEITTNEKNLIIKVIDTGIGIQKPQINNIFEVFQHGSIDVQKRYGGTGLGLSICEKLIQLHQGQIGVSSELGVGSTFCISLPIDSRKILTKESTQIVTHTPPQFGWRSLLKKYNTLIKHKHPKGPDDYIDKPHVFLIFSIILFLTVFGIAIADSYQPATRSLFLISGVIFSTLILHVCKVHLNLIIYSFLTYSCAHIVWLACHSGGSMSVLNFWLGLIPIASLFIFKNHWRYIWIAITFSCQFLISYLTISNQAPIGPDLTPTNAGWILSNNLSLMVLMLYLPLQFKYFRKQVRQDLKEQNDELSQTQLELVKQQRLKDNFISSVSHELRTPMNAIRGFHDLLADEVATSNEAKKLHDLVDQATNHLITVIDDIFDYTQLEIGAVKLKHEPFELIKVIQNAFEMFIPISRGSDVQLHLKIESIPSWVHGDKQRLTQILVNLLSNAIKFTHHGDIFLTVRAKENGIEFFVKDTGPGIAPKDLQTIFSQFEQASGATQHRAKGHGLGLSITKRLVEIQKGDIKVESKLGQGSLFHVRLPLKEATPIQKINEMNKLNSPHDPELMILIVDDHPLNRLLARQILKKSWPHAHIDEANDGLHALELLNVQKYDLILMDMIMPELDGVSTTLRIRSNEQTSNHITPILGLTANASTQARTQCLAAGMNEVIYKPFNSGDLIEKIEQLTQKICA